MRILKSTVALILALSALFLSSCGETPSGTAKRSDELAEYGFHYYIPEGFEYKKTTVAEFFYSDGEATCYFNHYGKEQLEEMEVDPDITVYNYTRQFMAWNNLPMNSSKYDEEKNIGTIETVSDFGAGSEIDVPAEYFRFQIMRGSQLLYVMVASCPDGMQEKYKPIFDEWFAYAYAE